MLAGLNVLYLLLQMPDDFKKYNRFIMIRCGPTNSPTILSHRTGKRHEMSCAETTSVTCCGSHVISIVIGFVLLPRPMKIYIRNGLLWFRCWRSEDLLSDWEVHDFGPLGLFLIYGGLQFWKWKSRCQSCGLLGTWRRRANRGLQWDHSDMYGPRRGRWHKHKRRSSLVWRKSGCRRPGVNNFLRFCRSRFYWLEVSLSAVG